MLNDLNIEYWSYSISGVVRVTVLASSCRYLNTEESLSHPSIFNDKEVTSIFPGGSPCLIIYHDN